MLFWVVISKKDLLRNVTDYQSAQSFFIRYHAAHLPRKSEANVICRKKAVVRIGLPLFSYSAETS